jgi:uncharacterized membrane protein YciS (DUF1049 family)
VAVAGLSSEENQELSTLRVLGFIFSLAISGLLGCRMKKKKKKNEKSLKVVEIRDRAGLVGSYIVAAADRAAPRG